MGGRILMERLKKESLYQSRKWFQSYEGRKHRKRRRFFLVLFFLGTGCLNLLLWKQNYQMEELEKKWSDYLVQQGFSTISYKTYADQQNDSQGGLAYWIKKLPVVYYLSGGTGKLEMAAQESVIGMAALYPGKNSQNIFWSGAGNDKIAETKLLQNLDENILLAQEEEEKEEKEKEDLEEAALAENQAVLEEEHDGGGGEDDPSASRQTVSITQNREGIQENQKKIKRLRSSLDRDYLLKNFYIVDSSTSIDNSVFDVEKLLNTNVSLKKSNKPQILIYHTHGASEGFIDSKAGDKSDSIVGVGELLAQILEEKYGYQVIHDETEYDRVNGKIDRNKAYNQAYDGITKQLKKNPQIQVLIDLHRDGVGNNVQRTTTINGKKAAQVMFFNGLSRNRKGAISYLPNPNLADNLAFSLQLKLKCMEKYPDLAKPVYLKSYRYNLHLRKRSVLVELGNENNTVAEARNAMEPLAEVLNQVLSGK